MELEVLCLCCGATQSSRWTKAEASKHKDSFLGVKKFDSEYVCECCRKTITRSPESCAICKKFIRGQDSRSISTSQHKDVIDQFRTLETSDKCCMYCYNNLTTAISEDSKLVILPSRLPRAGRGLFALKDFPKNANVTGYDGVELTKQEAKNLDPSHTAALVKGHAVIFGKVHSKESVHVGVGSLVNSSDRPNCKLTRTRDDSRLYLKACAPIEGGSEVLTNYGRDYKLKKASTTRGRRNKTRRPHLDKDSRKALKISLKKKRRT